eukprot:776651-Rhodomonas_salina.3
MPLSWYFAYQGLRTRYAQGPDDRRQVWVQARVHGRGPRPEVLHAVREIQSSSLGISSIQLAHLFSRCSTFVGVSSRAESRSFCLVLPPQSNLSGRNEQVPESTLQICLHSTPRGLMCDDQYIYNVFHRPLAGRRASITSSRKAHCMKVKPSGMKRDSATHVTGRLNTKSKSNCMICIDHTKRLPIPHTAPQDRPDPEKQISG